MKGLSNAARKAAAGRRRSWGGPVFACAALFTGCLLGGTGTGTGNGVEEGGALTSDNSVSLRYLDGEGRGMAGLRIEALPSRFSPLASLPAHHVSLPPESLVTDATGRLPLFRFKAPGTYCIVAFRGDEVVGLDSLRIVDTAARATQDFALRASKLWEGRLSLESRLSIDSGWLVVLGTRLKAKVDAQGRYRLGYLPAELKTLSRLAFTAYAVKPQGVTEAILVSASTPSIKDSTTLDSGKANTPIRLPNGMTPPDTIQILGSGTTTTAESRDSLVRVQCVPQANAPAGDTLCLANDGLTYRKNATANASMTPAAVDTTKPLYLDNGKIVPPCSASPSLKTSEALVSTAGGGESDLTVLDVSQAPLCQDTP